MNSYEFKEQILARLEALNDELARIKQTILDSQIIDYGDDENLDLVFDEDIYQELTESKQMSVNRVETMIHHLLKLTYCTTNYSHNQWRGTILRCMDKIYAEISDARKRSNIIEKAIEEELGDTYQRAVSRYKIDAKEHSDLVYNMDLIPKECPWTAKEIVNILKNETNDPANFILGYLPEPEDISFGVYLQIFSSVCAYLKGNILKSTIIGSDCYSCRRLKNCIEKYGELRNSLNLD